MGHKSILGWIPENTAEKEARLTAMLAAERDGGAPLAYHAQQRWIGTLAPSQSIKRDDPKKP